MKLYALFFNVTENFVCHKRPLKRESNHNAKTVVTGLNTSGSGASSETNLASWQLLVFSGCVYSDVNVLVRNQSSTQVIHLIQITFAIHHILERPSIMSSNPPEEFHHKILPWFSVFLRQCARVYNMWDSLSNCTSLKRHSMLITIDTSLLFYELSCITKTKPLVITLILWEGVDGSQTIIQKSIGFDCLNVLCTNRLNNTQLCKVDNNLFFLHSTPTNSINNNTQADDVASQGLNNYKLI